MEAFEYMRLVLFALVPAVVVFVVTLLFGFSETAIVISTGVGAVLGVIVGFASTPDYDDDELFSRSSNRRSNYGDGVGSARGSGPDSPPSQRTGSQKRRDNSGVVTDSSSPFDYGYGDSTHSSSHTADSPTSHESGGHSFGGGGDFGGGGAGGSFGISHSSSASHSDTSSHSDSGGSSGGDSGGGGDGGGGGGD